MENKDIPEREHIYTYDEIKEFRQKERNKIYETSYWNFITAYISDKICDFMQWIDPNHSIQYMKSSSIQLRLIKNERTREYEYRWCDKYE